MAAHITLAGEDVISVRLCMPLDGAWHADVTVDSTTVLSGKVTMTVGDSVDLVGTVRRGDVKLDTGLYRIVGGGGGLNKTTTPKSYRQSTLRIPLNDLLAISEDTLAGTADTTMLGNTLRNWSIFEEQVGVSITSLVKSQGADATWRILQDGTFWIGTDSWPTLKVDHDLIYEDARLAMKCIDLETPNLIPGVVFEDQRVTYVQFEYSDKGGRTYIWTEANA